VPVTMVHLLDCAARRARRPRLTVEEHRHVGCRGQPR